MDLKGSKTEKNLQTAFAGESQAHTKYQYYASAAKKEKFLNFCSLKDIKKIKFKSHTGRKYSHLSKRAFFENI